VASHTLEKRVGILELKVEKLETLPDRVTALEVQISEFRADVRAEFSATRSELRAEMRAMGEGLCGEMRAMNDDTRAQMRVLHEEVIARFNLLDEHPRWKRTTAPRPPKR
jgi:malate synthase